MIDGYTVVVKQVYQGWIGWIEEVPGVNCQEASYEELWISLRETLHEALILSEHEAEVAVGSQVPQGPFLLQPNLAHKGAELPEKDVSE